MMSQASLLAAGVVVFTMLLSVLHAVCGHVEPAAACTVPLPGLPTARRRLYGRRRELAWSKPSGQREVYRTSDGGDGHQKGSCS